MFSTFYRKLSLYISISIKHLVLQLQDLPLFHEHGIDERKALSSCLPSSNGREGREELVEQRNALHTAGCTRGPDEVCSRRLEFPQEVYEDGGAEYPVSTSTAFHP